MDYDKERVIKKRKWKLTFSTCFSISLVTFKSSTAVFNRVWSL